MATQNTRTMDVELCKNFLRWLEQTPDIKQLTHFEQMLKMASESPEEVLVIGLKKIAHTVDEIESSLATRLMTNPVGIFQTGMFLGFCMSAASAQPTFAHLLADLDKKTKNVTPISAAKGFIK
jgi:hypothetical protein